jgi:hypothetical protein
MEIPECRSEDSIKLWYFWFSWRQVWRWQPSGIQHCVISLKLTDVSEVFTASSIISAIRRPDNRGLFQRDYTALYPRRLSSSIINKCYKNCYQLESSLDRFSSVSIESSYGLDDRAIEVRSPAETKMVFSSSLCVQTGSGAHPSSCTMCNGVVLSPGVSAARAWR